ncbi:MAG: nucleotidyltransferase domain-containing protein [bacterium]
MRKISDEIKKQITKTLNEIEDKYDVKILYAVESGSRAWGFESKDSDFDIRAIYTHKKNWYLSIWKERDVIELMTDKRLDIIGWDLKKALKLLYNSNPPLLEWIKSPIIYLENKYFKGILEELEKIYFRPKSCLYHYLNMARSNYSNYLKKDIVRVKKYFYALRPILACCWIEKNGTAPPMEFEVLVDHHISDSRLKEEIIKLLDRKRHGVELDKEPVIETINEYIAKKIQCYFEYTKDIHDRNKLNKDIMNQKFVEILDTIYNKKMF